ncbi:hypothetical protein Scep_015747 [Stephania cephalantha]|uniref:Uncharacterized protein n=1 Tax=Stephania cephalantha TaxID=152367 RepID=A0AAP0J655_9MAGN
MAKPSPNLFFAVFFVSLLSLLLIFISYATSSPRHSRVLPRSANLPNPLDAPPPRVAYFISGSNGDGARIKRLLYAVYHPRNQYLLHLDLRASQDQREDLAVWAKSVEVFVAAKNVGVVGKADAVNLDGSTPIAAVLHGAAILLRWCHGWDWFVNLGPSDYPIITQDDFLHVLSFLPRELDLNFIEHSSDIGWKEYQRIVQVTVDPGLYLGTKGVLFTGSHKRKQPRAYKFFTGSPWVILSRKFVEFTILGLDNLPRTLLMYFSNTKSSHRGYFQTLACNTRKFSNSMINSNLRFVMWDNPPGPEPRNLKKSDFRKMIGSGAAFAGPFLQNDGALDQIDALILHRGEGRVAPGGWCLGGRRFGGDPCQVWGDIDILRPSPAGKRFERLLLRLIPNRPSNSSTPSIHR